jgi:hypothetical protein
VRVGSEFAHPHLPPSLPKQKQKELNKMEKLDNKKICPLFPMYNLCLENGCAWYISGKKECAINSIAQSLDAIEDKTDYAD